MGKYTGILLMSDFDGTLYADGAVSRENCEAIRRFQAEGGLFSLCSGRPPKWLSQWADCFVPNTWSVMLNGTLFCDMSAGVTAFDKTLGDDVIDFANEIRVACPKLDFIRFHDRDTHRDMPPDAPIAPSALPSPLYKLIFHAPAELSDKYTDYIKKAAEGRYLVARSWINGIELQIKGSGKGDAVGKFKGLLGERAATVVAVGDYENDIDMIRAADIGYAVENALPSVKDSADRITVSCRDSAIAKIIGEL